MSADEPETVSLECVVVAVVPEFRQAKVRAADGRLFAITGRTAGVGWAVLREGQRVRCDVTERLPRVVSATIVDGPDAFGQ